MYVVFLLGMCVCVQGWAMYDLEMTSLDYCKECPNKYMKIHYLQIGKFNNTMNVLRANYTVLMDVPLDAWFTFTAYEMKANNDYSKIPIRLYSGKYCTVVNNDAFYYRDIVKHSNLPRKCPYVKGDYYINDFRVNDRSLPPELPGDHWRYDLLLSHKEDDIMKFSIYIYIYRQVDWKSRINKQLKIGK